MAPCPRTFLCGMATIVALASAGATGPAAAATPGLVAAYSFDSSSAVTDASGNGNTGTTKNTTWVSSGKYGGALSYDGTSSWVTVADSPSLHFTSAFTAEAWVNPTTTGTAWQAVAAKERTGGIVFGLYANSNRSQPVAIAAVNGTERDAYGTSQVKSGTWTHLAETFDGSSVRLYVNGVLVSTTAASGSLPASTSPLRFGGDAVFNEFFHGLIDEARIYSRALTASEIATDMNTPIGSSSSADTTPPSTPGGLVASSVGQTSASLSWTASTDNTGVAGYGVYRDGVQVGSSTTTSTTVSGLTCATSYSLGVDAVDAAGNRSARATISVTTAACSGTNTGASFFVAPGGSDAGSCTSAQPCATFNRAVTLAAPGQVVQVAAGSYPAQSISAVKAGPAAVVVQPAPGAGVSVSLLDVSGSYVEVRGLTVTNAQGWSVDPTARFVTLRNVHSPRGWVVGDNTTIVGGEIGPVDSCTTNTQDGLEIWQHNGVASSHVTVDGVYIHDVSDHDNSCSGYPNSGVHDDCVQILAGHYTTIRNSTFYNCPTSNVIARPYIDTLDHLTIENNVLNPERRAGASLSIGSTGDTCANVVIQYNTAIGASSTFNCSTTMIVRGNIFPAVRGGLCNFEQAPQYSYNVFESGPACSSTDRVCTPVFVDPATRNFHLAATDTCAKDHGDPAHYPATDIDGQQRPMGPAPDVGADEVG